MSGVVKRQDKADIIAEQLETLYPEIPIPLDHTNAFELLVAVLMSAQTTDLKVNQVTPALFAKASSAEAMAALDVDTILADIRQVGLAPTKAKNIKRLSEMLVEHHNGEVPASFEALEALLVSATRPLLWSWLKPLMFPPFRWTPISTDLQHVGAFQTGRRLKRRKRTSRPSSLVKNGTTSTCKSSSSERILSGPFPRFDHLPHLFLGSDQKRIREEMKR